MDDESMKAVRQTGAEAISVKAIAIGAEQGVIITECIWNIGDDVGHEHAHRLDLITVAKTVRLYFPDLELVTSTTQSRIKRTEDRLRSAVAQLLPHAPAATYTYE